MVAVSRSAFSRAIEGQNCSSLLHPFEPQCSHAIFKLAAIASKGSAAYFLINQLAQCAMKYKTLSKEEIPSMVNSYIRSVLLGTWCPCAFTGTICAWKHLTGRYDKDIVAYGSGIISGLGIYLDDPERRPIVAYTVSALALEALIRRFYSNWKIDRLNKTETVLFMILNATLMYKMRTTEMARRNGDIWFFRPPRISKNKKLELSVDSETGETQINACPHSEKACSIVDCYKDIAKVTSKYVVCAMVFSAVRILVTRPKLAKRPMAFLKTLFNWNFMRPASFFGWYVGMYKAVSCTLCRITQRDRPEYAIAGGFIAGLSYGMNRNLTVLASVILYLARIFGRELQEKAKLPKFHSVEMSMIAGLTVLLNTKIFDPQNCPKGFSFMLNTITQNRFNTIFDQFMQLLQEEIMKS